MLAVASCSEKPPVTVEIEGLESRVVLVNIVDISKAEIGPQDVTSQHIVPRDGKFTVDSLPALPAILVIYPLDSFGQQPGAPGLADMINLVVLPGDEIEVRGSIKDNTLTYRVMGSPVNDAFAQLDTWALPLRKELAGINREISEYFSQEPTDQSQVEIKRLRAKGDSVRAVSSARYAALIEEHPDSEVCVARMDELTPADVVKVYPQLSQRIRQGGLGAMLDPLYYRSNVIVNRDEYPTIEKGQPVEFSLTTDKGEIFSPGTAGDKYVVLDFWIKPCPPRLRDTPKVEQYSRKYGDRIEFVGVGCFMLEPEWKFFIDEHNISSYTQVRDAHETGLIPKLGVLTFPTQIVLDPQGREIARFEPGGEDLWQGLDKIMK